MIVLIAAFVACWKRKNWKNLIINKPYIFSVMQKYKNILFKTLFWAKEKIASM